MASQSSGSAMASTNSAASAPASGVDQSTEEKNTEAAKQRKNTSFKITNILPSRPPSHDPEESGDDDPDDSHTEDISEHFEFKQVGNFEWFFWRQIDVTHAL